MKIIKNIEKIIKYWYIIYFILFIILFFSKNDLVIKLTIFFAIIYTLLNQIYLQEKSYFEIKNKYSIKENGLDISLKKIIKFNINKIKKKIIIKNILIIFIIIISILIGSIAFIMIIGAIMLIKNDIFTYFLIIFWCLQIIYLSYHFSFKYPKYWIYRDWQLIIYIIEEIENDNKIENSNFNKFLWILKRLSKNFALTREEKRTLRFLLYYLNEVFGMKTLQKKSKKALIKKIKPGLINFNYSYLKIIIKEINDKLISSKIASKEYTLLINKWTKIFKINNFSTTELEYKIIFENKFLDNAINSISKNIYKIIIALIYVIIFIIIIILIHNGYLNYSDIEEAKTISPF